MRNFFNWMLIAAGFVMVIVELILGAATGFDFALIGVSLAVGGAVGIFFESTRIGFLAAGTFTIIYFVFLRRVVRSKLSSPNLPSNADALIGRASVVTVRISANAAGEVKVGDEIWRAALARNAAGPRETGDQITVDSIEGVTLHVR